MNRFTKKFLFFFIVYFLVFNNIKAQSVGGTTAGSGTYCASTNAGFITLSGQSGSIVRWEQSINGGASWSTIANTTPAQSYSGLLVSTCYRAIVQATGFPADSSSITCITIYVPSVGGTLSGGGHFCAAPGSGGGTLTLNGITGNVLYWQHSVNGGVADTIANTTSTLTYTNITQNTSYWAVVRQGPTCQTDTSTVAAFTFDAVSVGGSLTGSDTVCIGVNGGTLDVIGNTGNAVNWMSSTNNGVSWTAIANTTGSETYSNLTQTTLYACVIKNAACPIDTTAYAKITVVLPVPVNAGSDVSILSGQSTVLNGTGTGIPVWSPGIGLDSTTKFKPIASPTVTTTYMLTVTDINSCVASDSVVVTVGAAEFNGKISNLFTPNGDGINDTWYIENIIYYADCEVFVYNIYGNLVYTKKGYTNDWQGTYNGSALPDGTYYYVLRFDSSDKIWKGSLDILRSK